MGDDPAVHTLTPTRRSTTITIPPWRLRRSPPSFVEGLQTGDVLLIRTGSGIGRIVRALDRTPFNHCAIHLGDGRMVHVLPPKSLRGNCVAVQPFDEMVATLEPQLIEARRPPADLGVPLAAGALDLHELAPAFSYNDLLVLAVVADTSDRLADAIGPVGPYLADQSEWELLLGAHFGVAGPEAITCSELVLRSLPAEAKSLIPRARRQVPDAWQQPIDPTEPLADELAEVLDRLPVPSARLHRRRGYTPAIAALGDYAVASGKDDLETPQLRVALSVLRHLTADFNERTPFDLPRLKGLLDEVLGASRGEWLARLTTPGDLARSSAVLRPIGLQWTDRHD